MKLKPYTLRQAQALVADSVARSQTRHERWRMLHTFYRYGSAEEFLDKGFFGGTGQVSSLVKETAEVPLHTVNMLLPHINVIVNSTIAQDPRLSLTAVGQDPADEERATVAEAVLSLRWKEADATDSMKRATHDSVKLGWGCVKTGWRHDEAVRDLDDDEIADQLQDLVANDLLVASADGRKPTPVAELRELCLAAEGVVVANKPYVEYVSPFDMFVPSDARRLDEARWVAQRLRLPLDEIKANPSYSNTELATSDSDADALRGSDHYDEAYDHSVFQYGTIYEFYDLRTRRLLVFQKDSSEPLYDGPMPEGLPQGSPFVEVRNYEVSGDEFWPFGDLDNLAPLQHLIAQGFTEQMDNMQASGQQYVARREHISDDVRDAIEAGIPRNVILLDDLPNDIQPSDAIQVLPHVPLPADIYNGISGLMEYMQRVAGINDFQAGGNGADRMSATAASLVDGVSSIRGIEKKASVERACEQVGQRILWLCQVWMDEEEWVRLAGPDGAGWKALSTEDIKGTFRVIVEGGSTSQINPATKANKALQAITTVIPAAVNLGMDATKLFRQAVRDLGYNPDLLTMAPVPEPEPELAPEELAPPELGPELAPEPEMPMMPQPQQLSDSELLALLAEGEQSPETSIGPELGMPSDAQLGGGIALA